MKHLIGARAWRRRRVQRVRGPSDTPEGSAFDVALVQANFTDACAAPMVVDEEFCLQVDIDAMTADGTTLVVATDLNPISTHRAFVICDAFARAHYDKTTGDDLRYEAIVVLDMNRNEKATCEAAERVP